MKNIILAFLLISIATACTKKDSINDANVYGSNLSNLPDLATDINFSVKILNTQNAEVNGTSSLKPNTIYQLKVSGEGDAYYRLKNINDFELVSNPKLISSEVLSTAPKEATFTIKTGNDISGGLIVNIVPLKFMDGKLYRARPKNFLFN